MSKTVYVAVYGALSRLIILAVPSQEGETLQRKNLSSTLMFSFPSLHINSGYSKVQSEKEVMETYKKRNRVGSCQDARVLNPRRSFQERVRVFVQEGQQAKNLSMVLLVHGGPWARDAWGYNAQVQWLTNRGYAVLQVNFRLGT
jgi:acetyl esterase/lipase